MSSDRAFVFFERAEKRRAKEFGKDSDFMKRVQAHEEQVRK